MAYNKSSTHWKLIRLKEGTVNEIKCTSCNRYLLRHTDMTSEGSSCVCHNNAEIIWPLGREFRLVKIVAASFSLIEIKTKDGE